MNHVKQLSNELKMSEETLLTDWSVVTELAPEDRAAVHPAVLSHSVRAPGLRLLPAPAPVLKYSSELSQDNNNPSHLLEQRNKYY